MNHISSYPSVYAIGHKAIADLFSGPVVIEEKIDGCVVPETPILCADLTYRPAGELKVKDCIIGAIYESNRWRLCESVVTHNQPIAKPCVVVATSTRTTTASIDHPLLVRGHDCPGKRKTKTEWVAAGELRVGMKILSLPMWSHEQSWESGYLAGMFDGEGTVVGPSETHNTRRLAFHQKAGPEADNIESMIRRRGFSVSRSQRLRNPKHKVAVVLSLGGSGDWTEMLEFLGAFRPPRLLSRAHLLWDGASTGHLPGEEVLSVTHIGNRAVSGLSTSTETYIANGLVSHNSQFSMCRTDGILSCRSKGKDLFMGAPEKMFAKAVATAWTLDLKDGWTYRCEYLQSPKHNTLAYERVPKGHLIVFDIMTGPESYLEPIDKEFECIRIGLECVPLLFHGKVESFEALSPLLNRTSCLGGCKIEGFVVKNYELFTVDKKVAVGKYVSEDFKERHNLQWRQSNPTQGDIVESLVASLRTDARWNKAIQHLRESGQLTDSLRDIGALMKEVQADVEKEEADGVKNVLYRHFWPQIKRRLTHGLPEFYKEHLAKSAFATTP